MIVSSVEVDAATVTEIALRHDVSRQQIYMWRSALKRKALLPPPPEPFFFPVGMIAAPLDSKANSSVDASSSIVDLQLRCGHRLCFGSQMEGAVLMLPGGGTGVIGLSTDVRVHLACGVTDMRKGIEGISMLAQDVCGKSRQLKLLYFDGEGFCLH